MKKYFIQTIFVFFVFFLISCSKEKILDDLELIKAVGNENPQKALVMLDSLEIEIRDGSDYAKSKYDLLRIRLNDKSNNIPNSDFLIKKLIEYFESKGSLSEKQEVYYYAGSVYRDLQDTPRALEYFFKSLDYVANNKDCDSMMLRNTYSNLSFLQYEVQNYKDAASMARKELNVSKKIGADELVSYMHIGASYFALDSLQQAVAAFDSVFFHIVCSKNVSQYQGHLVHLLCSYSDLGELAKAKKCLSLMKDNPLKDFDAFACIAFAQYYESCGKLDSAAIYCKRVLDDGTDIYNMYDATKILYHIYNKMGDVNKANSYAKKYMQLSSSLDFGKRQELAATTNNKYQYHLDYKKEHNLKHDKEKYRNMLVIVSFTALFLASVAYILYVRKRNIHLRKVIAMSTELQRVSNSEKQLREHIALNEMELARSKEALSESKEELDKVQLELLRVNAELSEYEKTLKTKERLLSEKMEQNKTFIQLLHRYELEEKAEDVICAVRQSLMGKKDMTPAEWRRLYQAVDELYPTFKERLLNTLGTFTEQQMQVFYLIRIGLSNPQIQNLTNLSRATIWRWVKKYETMSQSYDV